MTHIREQIRDRIATLVTGLPSTGANVFAMRRYALDDSKLPCILIYTNNEQSNIATIGLKTGLYNLEVMIEVITKSSSSTISDELDQICANVEAAIGADFQLNGLAKSCILTSTDISIAVDGENPLSSANMKYNVQYVALINSVETAR